MPGFIDKIKGSIIEPVEGEQPEVDEEETSTSTYEEAHNQTLRNVNAKMVIVEPRSYDEAYQIADHLKVGRACVVNIHRLNETNATRLLDFLMGVIYAIKGSVQKVDSNAFLFAPNDLPVDGNFSEED